MKKFQITTIFALFLLIMGVIVSGCVNNSSNNGPSQLAAVKPGDTVIVSFTLNDASGNPVLTSNQEIYNSTAISNKGVALSQPLTITANQSETSPIYPVRFTTANSGSEQQFALFSNEYNAISSAIVGMKIGDQKRVALSSASTMTQTWSAEQLQRNQVNMNNMNIGDSFPMGMSDNPSNSPGPSVPYTRIGILTSKSESGVMIDFGYPSADISIISIKSNN